MHIIKTEEDMQTLIKYRVLSDPFVACLRREFMNLKEAFCDCEKEGTFSLQPYGYIVVLEKGDHNKLASVGLSEGLMNSWPEYVERIELSSLSLYKIAVLYTNDYMMMFYTKVGIHDDKVEAWLADHCTEPVGTET